MNFNKITLWKKKPNYARHVSEKLQTEMIAKTTLSI